MKVTLIKPENSIDYVYLCLFYHLISYGKHLNDLYVLSLTGW